MGDPKNITAKKRTTAAVNRVLAAQKTLRQTLVKLEQGEIDKALQAMEKGHKDLKTFVDGVLGTPETFDFGE